MHWTSPKSAARRPAYAVAAQLQPAAREPSEARRTLQLPSRYATRCATAPGTFRRTDARSEHPSVRSPLAPRDEAVRFVTRPG
eukprot:5926687-Pleurochrysis_carterae.AAC.1